MSATETRMATYILVACSDSHPRADKLASIIEAVATTTSDTQQTIVLAQEVAACFTLATQIAHSMLDEAAYPECVRVNSTQDMEALLRAAAEAPMGPAAWEEPCAVVVVNYATFKRLAGRRAKRHGDIATIEQPL